MTIASKKTNGQLLYEHKAPEYIRVVAFADRHFATHEHAFLVRNPAEPTPWRFLTQKCKDSWERTAVGHNLFGGEASA